MAGGPDDEWESRPAYPPWVKVAAIVALVALLGFVVAQVL